MSGIGDNLGKFLHRRTRPDDAPKARVIKAGGLGDAYGASMKSINARRVWRTGDEAEVRDLSKVSPSGVRG